MKIKFHEVESSNLAGVYYSSKYRTLVVKFKSGVIWLYPEMPRWNYLRLKSAVSVGGYFAHNIRDAYQGFRLDMPQEAANISDDELAINLEASLRMINERKLEAS